MSILREMKLRDYFAIHSDQPGRLEIAMVAGVRVQEDAPSSFTPPERDALPRFSDWYRTLTQEERYTLQAKVRYEQADAMLAVRAIGE